MITVKHFTSLGIRTMPIGKTGFKLVRDPDTLKKFVVDKNKTIVSFREAMPPDWVEAYGKHRVEHADTPLGGAICGQLSDLSPGEIEIIALDCDDANTWAVFRALDPTYGFYFTSIGKAGGTIIYLLPNELKTTFAYSVKNTSFKLDYMALRESGSNTMVYLPTSANETKEAIPANAVLGLPPAPIIALIKSLAPTKVIQTGKVFETTSRLPYNAPLLVKYVAEIRAIAEEGESFGRQVIISDVAKRVYQVFTPKKFRSCTAYTKDHWIHPNDDELLPYSEYIVGVSAIAGADPSVDQDLYLEFMQAINAQIDVPYKPKRYLDEVLSPMVTGKAKIEGEPIWQYDENWDQHSLTISNQYGELLEYFIDEITPNQYYEYNHTSNVLLKIKNLKNLQERLYSIDSKKSDDLPSKSAVKKMKLIQEIRTVQQEPGLYVNQNGKTVINIEKAVFSLQIMKDPSLYPEHISDSNLYAQAFDTFLAHLLNNDKDSVLFMKQLLAYHGRRLEAIPVIIYIVGVGGAGKSEFAFMLEKLFGSNVTRRPQPKHLTGQWNDFLENCAILILSETGDASRRDQEGVKSILKQVTGERTMDISARFKPLRNNVPMFVLPVLLTNTPWYQEDVKDRRLFPIMPFTSIAESPIIADFEKLHNVRITEFIHEGIELGIISRWLTNYCPDSLPPVPRTKASFSVADVQDDPILKVKRLVALDQLYELITLMEDYDVASFFEVMNQQNTVGEKIKTYLYRNHLVDLVKNMREGALYPLDNVISKAFTPNNWLEMTAKYTANTRADGITGYKVAGRYRWKVENLLEVYTAWSIDNINSMGGEPND